MPLAVVAKKEIILDVIHDKYGVLVKHRAQALNRELAAGIRLV